MNRIPTSLVVFAFSMQMACTRSTPEGEGEVTATSPAIGYGTVMADVARRFEMLGRAASAGRFELAEYQLGEIEEQFEETLPSAAPPREGQPEVLPGMANEFARESIPELRRSLEARDRAQLRASFERVATACNACHQASGYGFIEVPTAPGRSIPNTDPVAPRSP